MRSWLTHILFAPIRGARAADSRVVGGSLNCCSTLPWRTPVAYVVCWVWAKEWRRARWRNFTLTRPTVQQPPTVAVHLLCFCLCFFSGEAQRGQYKTHWKFLHKYKFLFISCAIGVKINPNNVTFLYNDAHKRGINMVSPAMIPGRDVPCMPTEDH